MVEVISIRPNLADKAQRTTPATTWPQPIFTPSKLHYLCMIPVGFFWLNKEKEAGYNKVSCPYEKNIYRLSRVRLSNHHQPPQRSFVIFSNRLEPFGWEDVFCNFLEEGDQELFWYLRSQQRHIAMSSQQGLTHTNDHDVTLLTPMFLEYGQKYYIT